MQYFDIHHTVTSDEIDAQGHVHNIRYLKWTLCAAGRHSKAVGWDESTALKDGFGWVVRNHDVTYRAAAMEGDEIIIRTWLSDIQRFASRRKYVICRPRDQAVLARAATRWVYVDLRQRRVVAIPENVSSQISICCPAPALPWESSET